MDIKEKVKLVLDNSTIDENGVFIIESNSTGEYIAQIAEELGFPVDRRLESAESEKFTGKRVAAFLRALATLIDDDPSVVEPIAVVHYGVQFQPEQPKAKIVITTNTTPEWLKT